MLVSWVLLAPGGRLDQLDPREILASLGPLVLDPPDRLESQELVELKDNQENQEYQVSFCEVLTGKVLPAEYLMSDARVSLRLNMQL